MSTRQSLPTDYAPIDLALVESGFLSVQALDPPSGATMPDVMNRYLRWLPRLFRGAVAVRGDAESDVVVMSLAGVPAIRLRRREHSENRITFEVMEGGLAHAGGSFAFVRTSDGGANVVLEGFRPRLPRWLYARTQGRVHVNVMHRFAAVLRKQASDPKDDR